MIRCLLQLSIIFELAAVAYGQARCSPGFVWREAFSGDYVCVPPDARDQAAGDNTTAAGENAHQTAPGACKPGYVWREAQSTDHVCVTPAVRGQAWAENTAASRTTAPCRPGFVWREAFPQDYLCVTPPARTQAAQDNQMAAGDTAHQSASGACKPGYVWREASPQDHVCVTLEVRQQTKDENGSTGGNFRGLGGPPPVNGPPGGGAPAIAPPPAPPPPPAPAPPQSISEVQIAGGPSPVIFIFQTAAAAAPLVQVSTRAPGPDQNFTSAVPFSASGPFQKSHKIALTGLKTGPLYYYVISVPDGAGHTLRVSGKFRPAQAIDQQ